VQIDGAVGMLSADKIAGRGEQRFDQPLILIIARRGFHRHAAQRADEPGRLTCRMDAPRIHDPAGPTMRAVGLLALQQRWNAPVRLVDQRFEYRLRGFNGFFLRSSETLCGEQGGHAAREF